MIHWTPLSLTVGTAAAVAGVALLWIDAASTDKTEGAS
jgi:hypothetical protein